MLRLLIILTVGLHLGGSNEVFANSSIFFHCKGPGLDYQTIFEHDEAENKLIQKIQKPDIIHQGRIASETKTTITEFEISRGFINYVKNNNRFSILNHLLNHKSFSYVTSRHALIILNII